jgi:glycosyltransferase involved in cell wall biosynthesis
MTQHAPVDRDGEVLELQWESPDAAQPRASIVLTTWQHERFAAAAVGSALSQTVPFELVIRDDGSTDNTVAAVIAAVESSLAGSRATRVIVLRGLVNRGLGHNFTRAVQQCRCAWIFNFDGDDVSSPDRLELGLSQLAGMPEARAFFSSSVHSELIDDLPSFDEIRGGCLGDGILLDSGNIGATMAVRRDIVERFGPLPDRIVSHDQLLESRARLMGGVVFARCVVVKRRWHAANITRLVYGPGDPDRLRAAHRDMIRRIEDFAGCVRICPPAAQSAEHDPPRIAEEMILSVLRGWSSGFGFPGASGLRALVVLTPHAASKWSIAKGLVQAMGRPLKLWMSRN